GWATILRMAAQPALPRSPSGFAAGSLTGPPSFGWQPSLLCPDRLPASPPALSLVHHPSDGSPACSAPIAFRLRRRLSHGRSRASVASAAADIASSGASCPV